jgi:hypothetical protein
MDGMYNNLARRVQQNFYPRNTCGIGSWCDEDTVPGVGERMPRLPGRVHACYSTNGIAGRVPAPNKCRWPPAAALLARDGV